MLLLCSKVWRGKALLRKSKGYCEWRLGAMGRLPEEARNIGGIKSVKAILL